MTAAALVTGNFTALTGVTVATNPAGLAISVDGTAYTAPQTFLWAPGSNHTVAVSSPLSGPAGTRYVWSNWSDGGALSHGVVAPASPATYTASFTTQYLLTLAASPGAGGTLTPSPASPGGDGYYTSGTSVQVTASANSGYQFGSFSGALTGLTNPQTVNMTAVSSVTGTFSVVLTGTPLAVAAIPASGSGSGSTFTYTFAHPNGWQSLNVVNVLIGSFLDGRHACYVAYVVPTATLLLVNDAGDAAGPFAGTVVLSDPTVIANSQCGARLISAAGNGTTLTLTLQMTFPGSFSGNRLVYAAARDRAENNSGWQPLGVWQVPGSPAGVITAAGLSPAHGSGLAQTFTATFTDTKGTFDIGVVNLLINNFIDGRHGCYLAYVAQSNLLVLVNDAGDAGGPFSGSLSLGDTGNIRNTQCTVGLLSASSVGNSLTLTLNITLTSPSSGNQILFVAARDLTGGNNTDWQALGIWAVP
jgi:hypothetical protein